MPQNTLADPRSLSILLVEDHADTAASMELLLRLAGHEVRVARDGPSALRAAEAERHDVVLLDIGLPGMNGYEVAKRLTEAQSPFLVAITGYGREVDQLRAREAGFDLHLLKPADPEGLLRLLRCLPRVGE